MQDMRKSMILYCKTPVLILKYWRNDFLYACIDLIIACKYRYMRVFNLVVKWYILYIMQYAPVVSLRPSMPLKR